MVYVLRHPRPGIAEVKCSRVRFEPGDRVLVHHFGELDRDQERRLRRSIRRWAGVEVVVLIVDSSRMEVRVEAGRR